MYKYVLIDPRNPVVLPNTLGIEVTDPKIAAMCDLGNVDPQHGCGRDSKGWVERGEGSAQLSPGRHRDGAAVDAALLWMLPPVGATLATIRPDLDSIGAMALLTLRSYCADPENAAIAAMITPTPADLAVRPRWADDAYRAFMVRVIDISASDRFAGRGEWTPRPLPAKGRPWATHGSVEDLRQLAPLARIVADREIDIDYRVACIVAWLLGGSSPALDIVSAAVGAVFGGDQADALRVLDLLTASAARAEAERADMVAALVDGRITVHGVLVAGLSEEPRRFDVETWADVEHPTSGYDIAIVHSAHRGAMACGYAVAPVVVAFHPAFPWPKGEPTSKVTVGFFVSPGVERMAALRDALNAAEPGGGWGGNLASGILGSPQGRASALSEAQILALVRGAPTA